MPPRTGQIDQISEALGELKGLVTSIDKYVHEHNHGVNNLSLKMDAMALEQAKRHESLKLELSAQMDKMADSLRSEIAKAVVRIEKLERRNASDDGVRSVWKWLVDHSPIATLIALLAAIAARWRH